MSDVHIYSPKVIELSFRILSKFCRKFIDKKFETFNEALTWGLTNNRKGFIVFQQFCYEWQEPSNHLLAKIEDITRVKE